jgi:hypothetical protein
MIPSAHRYDTITQVGIGRAEELIERTPNFERSRLLKKLELDVDIRSELPAKRLAAFESRSFYVWSDALAGVFDRCYVHFFKNIPFHVRYCLSGARYRYLQFFTFTQAHRFTKRNDDCN